MLTCYTGPGSIQIALGVGDKNIVSLLRAPQSDITWSLEEKVPSAVVHYIGDILKAAALSQTVRSYRFQSLAGKSLNDILCPCSDQAPDAQLFEFCCTGFSIVHDW